MTVPAPVTPALTTGKSVTLPEMPEHARKIRQHIADAWKAYRGDWTGKLPLKHGRDEPNDNTLSNRCAPIVDKGVSFLFGKPLTLEVKNAEGDSAAPAKAQKALDAALGDIDDFMTTLSMAAMNGGVAGHTFVKLIPAQQDNDSDTDYPRIVVQDPQNYWIITDADDVNCVLQYVCEYELPSPKQNYVLTKRIVTGREAVGKPWTITTYLRERPNSNANNAQIVSAGNDGGSAWNQVGPSELWPHKWSPIHDCMNLPNPNEFWGISDLTPDIIHLNDVLNNVQSNITKIGRLHAHPWVYALAADASNVTTAPGSIICFPSAESKLGVIEAHGDIANLRAHAADLRSDIDEQSRIPAVALGRVTALPTGNFSGVALKTLETPLIEKTTIKRRLYGKLIRCLCEHILELCGFPGLRVCITWPDMLPTDDAATAQLVSTAKQAGMSDHFLCELLDVDYETELEYRQEEQKEAMRAAMQGQGAMPALPQQQPAAGAGASGQPGGDAGQPSASAPTGQQPPTDHPAAVRARQVAQAAAGKKPTANGMKTK